MGISVNTVKRYPSAAMDKLHICRRQGLNQYMLRQHRHLPSRVMPTGISPRA